MVKHVILWKLKEELTAEEKENVKAGIKEGLEGLAGNIPGLVDIKVTDGTLVNIAKEQEAITNINSRCYA